MTLGIALNPTSPPSTMMPAVSAIAIVTADAHPDRHADGGDGSAARIIASVRDGDALPVDQISKMKANAAPAWKTACAARRRQNRAPASTAW